MYIDIKSKCPSIIEFTHESELDPDVVIFLYEVNWLSIRDRIGEVEKKHLDFLVDIHSGGLFVPAL